MKETEQLKNLMESMDSINEEEPRAAQPGIPGVARTSVKGEGTAALRKVLADFGFKPLGSIYSDKRQYGRRVKAVPIKPNAASIHSALKIKVPELSAVEASAAKHFEGMEVLKVVVHKSDRNKFNDHNYIAVAYL